VIVRGDYLYWKYETIRDVKAINRGSEMSPCKYQGLAGVENEPTEEIQTRRSATEGYCKSHCSLSYISVQNWMK
jgi:hypothetical protein